LPVSRKKKNDQPCDIVPSASNFYVSGFEVRNTNSNNKPKGIPDIWGIEF